MRLYRDESWLRKEYIQKERSTVSIGLECQVCPMTVWRWLKKFKIKTRTVKESLTGKRKMKIEEALNLIEEIDDFLEDDEFKDDATVQRVMRLRADRAAAERRLAERGRRRKAEKGRLASQLNKERAEVENKSWTAGSVEEQMRDIQDAYDEPIER